MFLERIQTSTLLVEAENLYNLKGGIFRWYHEGHSAVDQDGPTRKIHPYDETWGKMIKQDAP